MNLGGGKRGAHNQGIISPGQAGQGSAGSGSLISATAGAFSGAQGSLLSGGAPGMPSVTPSPDSLGLGSPTLSSGAQFLSPNQFSTPVSPASAGGPNMTFGQDDLDGLVVSFYIDRFPRACLFLLHMVVMFISDFICHTA